MDAERKSRLVFYFQVIIGVFLYALFNDTSFIAKASEDLANRTSRKKAVLIVLSALAILTVVASIAVVLLGSAKDSSLSDKSGADQALVKQELMTYFLEHNVQGEPQFFPIDDHLRVEASLGKPADEYQKAVTSDSLVQASVLSFSISDKEFSLPVYYASPYYLMGASPSAQNALILLFKDLTNGSETPSEGRYLLLPIASDRIDLDFNQARLLPCFYFKERPCPQMAGVQNITVAITAGQKK